MTTENNRTSGGAGSWIGILCALVAAAVLWGLRDNAAVEVFGFEMSVLVVGLVLWLLGFLGGMLNRRRQG